MKPTEDRLEKEDVARYGEEFAARLQAWEAGGLELSEEELERYLAGLDPDTRLIGLYLDGELTPAETDAVDMRLLEDDVFYRKAAPHLEREALVRSVARAPSPRIGERSRRSGGSRGPRRPLVQRIGALAAASMVAVALGGGAIGAVWATRSQERAAERREGRAITTHFLFTTYVVETDARPRRLNLAEADVALGSRSRLETGLPWPVSRQLRQFATLDGSATFDVRPVGLRVVTTTAEVRLARGRYEIVSVPGSGETTLRVYSGSATVHIAADVRLPAGARRGAALITVGEQARIRSDGTIHTEVIGKTMKP